MINTADQTILVTGGAGFIGSNLIRSLLKKNYTVHALLKPSTNTWRINDLIQSNQVTIHRTDLSDAQSLRTMVQKINPSIIYHLAAQGASHSQNDAEIILNANIIGTHHLIQACASLPYKLFVNIGSSSEYGFSVQPMHEKQTLYPNSYYAIAKAAQTMLVTYEAVKQRKPLMTIRLFSVYGPYESSHKLFPTLLHNIQKNLPVSFTNKQTAHDFIYIDDVTNGLLQIDTLAKQAGTVLNFGTGVQTTLAEVEAIAKTVTNKKIQVQWDSSKAHRWDTTHWVANTTQVKKVMNWHPRSFEQGLKLYWQWYQQHSSIYSEMI